MNIVGIVEGKQHGEFQRPLQQKILTKGRYGRRVIFISFCKRSWTIALKSSLEDRASKQKADENKEK